ncbi:hypothetical protein SAMN05216218_10616 [Halorientalis regularis]|uniref:Uncharacterized protein n=1 Tax=Halorientalis regularis TaxID=660518 RepID=A0A1G7KSN2_9EURY|nr:hypothetical protein SAMN05216218_10616 [Halorientalis regularis]
MIDSDGVTDGVARQAPADVAPELYEPDQELDYR